MTEQADRTVDLDRAEVRAARRMVIKVGSSSLTTAAGGLDAERVGALVDALISVRSSGREIVLVSSGAIAAGLAPLALKARPRDLATQQAAASVGQGLLVQEYAGRFARAGLTVGQVLLTVDDVTRKSNYRNASQTFDRLLELGVVPIVNENDTVATHEIRFGDNDRLAALVAHLVHADALIMLSDVDSLYTSNPSKPGARRVAEVFGSDDLAAIDTDGADSGLGTGGMATKINAAQIATSAGIPVILANAAVAADALAGDPVGTYFHPTGKRRPGRLLWLAHATDAYGELILDAGAVDAVLRRKASLLPAGVTAVRGTFSAGDPVNLVGPDGVRIARGLANYDSDELPELLGRSTSELLAELGEGYDRTVVHRDALIVLDVATAT
ncbi:glutamate 5-kinase [Microlunatus elymi]|uniref:Glutamate 5-kinase n=1 Tax=Microlunatus elymi TaxID=2596828 RepID=A0A516PXQ7_9ACTN|nr:glutamate 5-kinase [Microlunatus elymi]QDP95957.1 glutamate 5-kinase [Microlunatus elymi]